MIGATAAEGWRLERHGDGRLDFIDPSGRRHRDVDVVRGFPVTDPAGPVAVVASQGDELVWVDALGRLPTDLRGLLEAELAQREFLPVIQRIDSVSASEPAEWRVVTDRGPHRFNVAHPDDVSRRPDGSAFVTDVRGMRYLIRDVAALDHRSRRLLERLD